MTGGDAVDYAPVIVSGIFGFLTAGLVGFFSLYNRRRGNVENKTPTVAEIWAEQRSLRAELDEALHLLRNYGAAFEGLRTTFKGYVLRVQRGGNVSLTKTEKAALELPLEDERNDV